MKKSFNLILISTIVYACFSISNCISTDEKFPQYEEKVKYIPKYVPIYKTKYVKRPHKLLAYFVNLLHDKQLFERSLVKQFNIYDVDKNGKLCKSEVKKFLIEFSKKYEMRQPSDKEFENLWAYIPKKEDKLCLDEFRILYKIIIKNTIMYLERLCQIVEIKEFIGNKKIFIKKIEKIFKKCDTEKKGKIDKKGVKKALNLVCDELKIERPNDIEFEKFYKSVPKQNGLIGMDECRNHIKTYLKQYSA